MLKQPKFRMASAGAPAPELDATARLAKYKELVGKLRTALSSARADVQERDASIAALQASLAAKEGTRPAGTEPATSRGFDLEALATTEEAFDVGVQAIVHCDGGAGGDSEEWLLACARTVPDRPGEPGRCLARGWVLRQSVQPYLSPGMELPGPFISPAAAEELRLRHDAAKQRLAACEEEFRKFRVSANTTIRQLKEAGVPETQAQATQEPLPHRPAVHAEGTVPLAALTDIKAELRATQQELAAVAHERAELSVRVERLRKEVQSTRAAHASTKDEVEAWRLRCLEAEAALGGAAPAATPQRPATSGGTGDAPPAVQLAKLQQEFSTYRSQAVGLLRGKVETIAALKARVAELEGADSTVQAVDDSLLTAAGAEYLRNVLLQYMCAHDGSIRRTLEATIATVLHFTPEEIRRVKAARDSAASAAGVAGSIFSSLGSALTSVVGGGGGGEGGGAPPAPAQAGPPAQAPPPAPPGGSGSALGGSSLMDTLSQHEIR